MNVLTNNKDFAVGAEVSREKRSDSSEYDEVAGTSYCFATKLRLPLEELTRRVQRLREGTLPSADTLSHISKFFRIKNIYNSNAIEGNQLNIGETRLVVEQGITITGRSLKDQAEAKNLSQAIDFMEKLAADRDTPITESDLRQIHSLILTGIDQENAGKYRSVAVEISGSRYSTPGPESVPALMSAFSEWLKPVSVPGQRYARIDGVINAVLGHAWLVYIHPFVDGNGRLSRILMNLLLMRYGFPIAIIARDDRKRYYDALEESQSGNLTDFMSLVMDCDCESVDEYESAILEQRQNEEWARQFAERLTSAQSIRFRNEYEIWKSSMDLLKNYFGKTVLSIDAQAAALGMRVYFRTFDELEFEKYQSLRNNQTTKRTWFFRVDFRNESKAARYLFFFGPPSGSLRDKCDVTVHIAREESPFYFQRLERINSPNTPTLIEIGYLPDEEVFVARSRNGNLSKDRVERIGHAFMEQIANLHFSS